MIDIERIRADFPILSKEIYGTTLVYLDSGASSQKPKQVIDAISKYYSEEHSNVHRGVHFLSSEATTQYEEARKKIQSFINAKKESEIIFTKGTTDSINLIANSFGQKFINAGDEVIISEMEHHSNIVPWQMICDLKQATLKVIPINDTGELIIKDFKKLLTKDTKLVAITHVSNTLGTVNPIREIIKEAHNVGAKVLIDGAQAVPHMEVDVQALDCDFYAFSGHKMYGPTGIGVLYGKEDLLNKMPPYQGGGSMIKKVTFEKTTYNDLPEKFEAGTPNIAGVIGLGKAVDYMLSIGINKIHQHETALLEYATKQVQQIKNLRIIGTANQKAGVLSFVVGATHPFDTGTILDRLGIAVRTGHHCTEPLMNRYNISGTVRASFGVYNTFAEIDKMIEGIKRSEKMFA